MIEELSLPFNETRHHEINFKGRKISVDTRDDKCLMEIKTSVRTNENGIRCQRILNRFNTIGTRFLHAFNEENSSIEITMTLAMDSPVSERAFCSAVNQCVAELKMMMVIIETDMEGEGEDA